MYLKYLECTPGVPGVPVPGIPVPGIPVPGIPRIPGAPGAPGGGLGRAFRGEMARWGEARREARWGEVSSDQVFGKVMDPRVVRSFLAMLRAVKCKKEHGKFKQTTFMAPLSPAPAVTWLEIPPLEITFKL